MSVPVRAQIKPDTATHNLWRIAESDDFEQLEQVLAHGADVNARNSSGVTALMVAAYHGRLRMVRALIEHGAELNEIDKDGFTAVMLADHSGHQDVVRTLVACGANIIPRRLNKDASLRSEAFGALGESDVARTGRDQVVRTLKDPPEIWDLVHEARTEFNPSSAFVGRLTRINPLALAAIALIIGGGAVFGVMKFRGSPRSVTAPAPVRAEGSNSLPASSSPASNSTTTASSSPASSTITTATTLPASVPNNTASSNQPPAIPPASAALAGSKVDPDIPLAAPSALSFKPAVKSRRQNPTRSITASATLASGNNKAHQTSTTPGPKSDSEKVADPTAAKRQPDKAQSPQLIAPAKTSPTPKAKVIQWP